MARSIGKQIDLEIVEEIGMAAGEGHEVWAVERDQHGAKVVEKLFWHEEDAKRYIADMKTKFPTGFPRTTRLWRVH